MLTKKKNVDMSNNKKYDVFISYSRKDYMLNDEIIPGNPISAIQELFEENKISYWFDKDGIYSGSEFMPLISDAISDSKILVFISSKHSNESKWTAGEILEALNEDKLVIPVRIDESKYTSVRDKKMVKKFGNLRYFLYLYR